MPFSARQPIHANQEAVPMQRCRWLRYRAKLCKRSRNSGYLCNVRNNRTNKLRVLNTGFKANSPRLHHNRTNNLAILEWLIDPELIPVRAGF
jgi:hypothetical protein